MVILLSLMVVTAQNYNPFVTGARVSSTVLLPKEAVGTGQFSFNIGNSGTEDIKVKKDQEMLIVISLSNGVPAKENPIASIGGTFRPYFSWRYNETNHSFIGTQLRAIPGKASASRPGIGNTNEGTIIIDYKVEINSGINNPQNGFNVNITPPPFTNGINNRGDDNISLYAATAYQISGQVINDGKGRGKGALDGKPTNLGGNLFVSLLNRKLLIIATVPVKENGTFKMYYPVAGDYSLVLHTNPEGSNMPGLPDDWQYTIEDIAGNQPDIAKGKINISLLNANPEGLVFGINRIPETENVEVYVPGSLTKGQKLSLVNEPFTGSDPELSPAKGSISKGGTFIIKSLPTGALLNYQGVDVLGKDVAAARGTAVFKNFDPAGLKLVLTSDLEKGRSLSFDYASIDPAGAVDKSPATYKIYAGGLMPANGLVLTGKRNGVNVKLDWETLIENNSDWFIIERSIDGIRFDQVGQKIKAAGNSTTKLQYTYEDYKVTNEVALYRIKLLDKEGKTAFSNTFLQKFDNLSTGRISVFPNPVKDQFYVAIDTKGNYQLELLDATGKVVYRGAMNVISDKQAIETISRGNLAAGQYFLRATNKVSGKSEVLKVMMVQY